MIKFSSLLDKGFKVRTAEGKYGERIEVYWRPTFNWFREYTRAPYKALVLAGSGGLLAEILRDSPEETIEEAYRMQDQGLFVEGVIEEGGIRALSFSLAGVLRTFLAPNLPDGSYLVSVSKSVEDGSAFWTKRGNPLVKGDCVILDITNSQCSAKELAALQKVSHETRCFNVVVEGGYTSPVQEL